MTTPSPLLSRPGAVEAAGADAGVAAHYGEPLREQRAARSRNRRRRPFPPRRGDRQRTGPADAGSNTLSSQQVTGLQPRESSELLLLSVQGRIEFDARVVDDGGDHLADRRGRRGCARWLSG